MFEPPVVRGVKVFETTAGTILAQTRYPRVEHVIGFSQELRCSFIRKCQPAYSVENAQTIGDPGKNFSEVCIT
ncbi:MAG TPA: hypothetical protein VE422_33080 [Terriglobia bacterium]|nr:hypothetical protein [Terriglobia bacterium]